MDSGNSGSLQSSSGGDEEYDSRTESISALLNPPSHHHQTQPPSASSSSLFDYLDSISRSPAPPLNLDMVWSKGLRSEPPCTEIQTTGLMGSSSSSTQPITGLQASSFQGSPSTTKNGPNPVRNSKKRSRASRRAPTTVLTTDTSNFRAMVQEFTGIPAPPFSASPFSRNRFDLFNTSSMTTLREPPPPAYLLRPFAQKFHPPSSASATNRIGTNSGASTTTAANSINNNQQLLSDLGLNMQNPIFTFQSLLQSSGPPPAVPSPRYPLTNVPVFGEKSQGSSQTVVENFTMGNHGMSLRNDNNNDPSSWGDGMGLNDGDQSQAQVQAQAQAQLKSFNGSCKMNYANSSFEFQVEKGSENVSSRGEGMVDSWICSSD
ncbi:hypothetical protein NE237_017542 [Protea cynaroides]|uniref:VQ domain-containing protein n=1 Tax=Protea cynaroides TaxID=273540 RepID=A0A9Q0K885_9MAGN|nr:hypothetical protein NE237_017542 [Protea cynaroides]